MATWNWLDCILAAIVVASIVAAIVKGFVQELISLASVVIGLVVAAFGYPRAALWFDDLTKSHEIALGLGFLHHFPGYADRWRAGGNSGAQAHQSRRNPVV